MQEKVKQIIGHIDSRQISEIANTFLRDKSIGGKLIIAAAILSLYAVNSSHYEQFTNFWHTPLSVGIGSWSLSMDFRHWLNEGLMAFFFLIVGLEIKRELVKGELKEFKAAILPIGAAVGGMIFPALIYLAFNGQNPEAVKGWGIPIATDIAFAVAVLALLGRRVPLALKIFLLTLAIADDIGAIFVIALFYAEIIHYGFLAISIALVIAAFLFRKKLVDKLTIVIIMGAVLWVTTHLSGIHASIVGAALGLLAPVAVGKHRHSVAERVERFFLPIVTFMILPLFAFANAGFVFSTSSVLAYKSVVWGVVLGLVVGKAVGITLVSWILVKSGVAVLPRGLNWQHIIAIGMIAGIGFTVSIFITELAFYDNPKLIDAAKISTFIASGLSALVGSLLLLTTKKHKLRTRN